MRVQARLTEEMVSLVTHLRGSNLRTVPQLELEDKLKQLLSLYKAVGVTRSVGQTWFRARVANEQDGFANVSEMIYRPEGSSFYGRASMPNTPVLYASWNIMTALEEVRAQPGDLVQLISLRVRNGIEFPCDIVGELCSIYNSGGSLINSRSLEKTLRNQIDSLDYALYPHVFIDAFLAEQFSRKADHHTEYKLTATYANKVLAANRGLMYPSVQAAHGVNLAIAAADFDKYFEVMTADLVKIEQYFGYGLYGLKLLKRTNTFAADGTFLWNSATRMTFKKFDAGGVIFDVERGGWRKMP